MDPEIENFIGELKRLEEDTGDRVITEANVIRVKPRTFEDGWREDLLSIGIHIPDVVPTMSYAPIAHSPMPFSVEIDLDTMTLTRRVVGVMPNAMYRGKMYTWEELCELVGKGK